MFYISDNRFDCSSASAFGPSSLSLYIFALPCWTSIDILKINSIPFFADSFVKIYHVVRIARKVPLKLSLSTEILIIRILNPLIYNAFVAKITQNLAIWRLKINFLSTVCCWQTGPKHVFKDQLNSFQHYKQELLCSLNHS